MPEKPELELRGDAAWKAEKERIAKRNDAAYARGRAERESADSLANERRHAADMKEREELPSPPR